MTRPERLTSSPGFRRVLTAGRRVSTPSAVCVVAAGAQGAQPRVGVTAAHRIGGAVVRNRAKRLLREAVRHLPLREGVEVVLIARPPITGKTCQEVERDVASGLRGAGAC